MPRSRFSDGVVLERLGEDGAVPQQHPEAADQLRPVALQVVRAQLVDRDHDDDPGAGSGRDARTREQQCDGKQHGAKGNADYAAAGAAAASPRGTRRASNSAQAMTPAQAKKGTRGPSAW